MTESKRLPQFERQFAWANRAVLVLDVVESVRLVEHDEVGAISRWFDLLDRVKSNVLPEFGGRLVKTLGDGMLLDFADVRNSVSAGLAIRQTCEDLNASLPPEQQMLLRIGIEVSDVIIDGDDVHGRGVILATRLMTLAGPDEIVISQHVRDRLTLDLDAEIEDLGDCFVRHMRHPIRAYRIGPPHDRAAQNALAPLEYGGPAVAVIPFVLRRGPNEHDILGEALAEEIIRALAQSPDLSVISRLSTTAFRARGASLDRIAEHLRADYVLSGSYATDEQRVTLNLELAEAKSSRIIWTDRLEAGVSAVLGEEKLIKGIVAAIYSAIELRELQRARQAPPPTLRAYTLLLGAISLMHRLALSDFEEARHLLETLLSRGARQPLALSWLANWHVLRVQQGWSPDPKEDASLALQCTKRALEMDPDCALASTIEGSVRTSLLKDLDEAMLCYQRAIDLSPSHSLAWLLKGTLHAFRGKGKQAVEDTQRALKLSPLDPHRYYYESLAATALLADAQYERALEVAKRSLRANRQHTSTVRVITVAQWRLGDHDGARKSCQDLLRLEPTFTVSGWQARSPSAQYPMGLEAAEVFRLAGAPE
jgi:class 3 adenylate cyclase/tetratricopeptide (TPR) repeat protein